MDATASVPESALLVCRLCDLSFNTAAEKRQHAKSEWHVYKIRCRVSEPGTPISPPGGERPSPSSRRPEKDWKQRPRSPYTHAESDDGGSESDASSERDIVGFIPEECLFCSRTSEDFDGNILHMHQSHGLAIPFQSSLSVELETLVWFLRMVIFTYRECICCGKRLRTVEAVQQHMTSMGHCRFEVSEEMSSLYDMDSLGQRSSENYRHPDEHTLRLPSGKLLGHRSHASPTSKRGLRERSSYGPSALPDARQSDSGPQILTRRDQKEQALTHRLSRLRSGDQMSLVHLPEAQRRSLLVAHKKGLDEGKRAERQKQGRMDRVGNKTAIHTNYYKQEVPVYMGG